MVAILVACATATGGRGAEAGYVDSRTTGVRVRVRPPFRHVASQEFVLRDRVAIEQHLFTHGAGELLWVQFESLLPRTEGAYSYPRTGIVTLGGIDFAVSTRDYTKPPEPDSDRARAYAALASAGIHFATPARRARFIHIPTTNPRAEAMIIYATTDPNLSDTELIERARHAFDITRW